MSDNLLTYRAGSSENPIAGNSDRFALLAFWGGTLFLSAFLLFQVQPVLAKLILPWFGGAAAVWTTSLMFFQVAYLLGNLYAYWLAGRTPRSQSRVHIVLLAASLFFLPILPKAAWKPPAGASPILYILGVLATTVGLPFVILSASSPLLQAWYVRRHEGVRPYRFYALSNAGSFLALFSYPVLVEPHVTTRHQAIAWSLGYVVFASLCAALAFRQRDSSAQPAKVIAEAPPRPNWKLQLLWVALAADAAALLLAVTNYILQNVAAVPMLWIVPLALYLLSLILCFEGHGWYRRFFFLRLLAVALGGMAYALSPDFVNAGPLLQVPLFCIGLFVCCMVCHGELEKLKPHHEFLTLFYLLLSAGGALGGIFVAVIAPWQFNGLYELPIAVLGCALLTLIALYRDPATLFHQRWWHPASLLAVALTLALAVGLYRVTSLQSQGTIFMARNFYGLLRVSDLAATDDQPPQRELINGAIIHGIEILEPDRMEQPTTYFGPDSGAGIALLAARKRGNINVGIVGLGAGTLAAYGQAGDHYVFYEINPQVIQTAQTQFDFLSGSQAQIEITPGDARLSIERDPSRIYDVMLIDAFAGDAIPIHLLTREAFELYLRHLRPHGLLVIQISNKYLDLEPVVRAGAGSLGLSAATVINARDDAHQIYTAAWVILARDNADLPVHPLPIAWQRVPPKVLRPWTDDYSNLLQILR